MQLTTLARCRQTKSPNTCQMASAGALTVIVQEACVMLWHCAKKKGSATICWRPLHKSVDALPQANVHVGIKRESGKAHERDADRDSHLECKTNGVRRFLHPFRRRSG